MWLPWLITCSPVPGIKTPSKPKVFPSCSPRVWGIFLFMNRKKAAQPHCLWCWRKLWQSYLKGDLYRRFIGWRLNVNSLNIWTREHDRGIVKNDNWNLLLITPDYRSLHFSHVVNVWKTDGCCVCICNICNKIKSVGITSRTARWLLVSRLAVLLFCKCPQRRQSLKRCQVNSSIPKLSIEEFAMKNLKLIKCQLCKFDFGW